MSEKHLWEYDHPYYANEGNFFRAGLHTPFDSWAEFTSPEYGNLLYDGDEDLNMLWRFDWRRPDPSDYRHEIETDPAFVMPSDKLMLYYMLQRKGYNISAEVAVTEADEPAVREWLTKRAERTRLLWEPLLGGVA